MFKKIGFIGLGLIGGSIAKTIRSKIGDKCTLLAYDIDEDALTSALSDGILDEAYFMPAKVLGSCDILFLCAPVVVNNKILEEIKPYLSKHCLITDVGSVKTPIHEVISSFELEKQFIGGHPMAGSEKTGFTYSSDRLLENAYYILTPTEKVSNENVTKLKAFIDKLGAIPVVLSPEKHDYVTAAISHLPHIISASLVNLVNESDDKDGVMRLIAAGGFKDITRISSSDSNMWQQISLTNRENIEALLARYIQDLSSIKEHIHEKDASFLLTFFQEARDYRDSFTDTSSGPIKKIYRLYVDIPDVPGIIATIATLLAKKDINIKNIGIIHNREFEEGALRIEFYNKEDLDNSAFLLKEQNYTIHE